MKKFKRTPKSIREALPVNARPPLSAGWKRLLHSTLNPVTSAEWPFLIILIRCETPLNTKIQLDTDFFLYKLSFFFSIILKLTLQY